MFYEIKNYFRESEVSNREMVIESGYFGTSSDKILMVDSIASKEELDIIVNTAENMDIWDNTIIGNIWNNRVSNFIELRYLSPETFNLIFDIQNRFLVKVSEFYNVRVQPPNPSIARWFVGNEQAPHYDKKSYPNYDIGSIIYLNNEYEGGEIYFPQHDIEIRPVAGNAFAFPGDEHYMHGVRKITSGCRYTLPVFWKVIED
jgi:hypothetical protein